MYLWSHYAGLCTVCGERYKAGEVIWLDRRCNTVVHKKCHKVTEKPNGVLLQQAVQPGSRTNPRPVSSMRRSTVRGIVEGARENSRKSSSVGRASETDAQQERQG